MFRKLINILLFSLAALMPACSTTEKIAEGIAVKNVSGNGTFVRSSVGIDPDSKIPGLHTTFVSGDLATAKSGTNSVTYREESSASMWNARSVTKKRFLSITLVDDGRVAEAILSVADVLRASASAEHAKTEEKADVAASAGN